MRDRILLSISILQPCSVAKVWKTISQDLQAKHVTRERVYAVMYSLKRAGMLSHRIRARWELSEAGREQVEKLMARRGEAQLF